MLVKILKEDRSRISIKHQFDMNANVEEFMRVVEAKFGVSDFEVDIFVGYPPKQLLEYDDDSKLNSLGIENGTSISIRNNEKKKLLFQKLVDWGYSIPVCSKAVRLVDSTEESVIKDLCDQLELQHCQLQPKHLVRRIIDADNSCLFNAVGYLMCDANSKQKRASHYRSIVASAISEDSTAYAAQIVDSNMTPEGYAEWILDPQKWGGEIEMSILSNALQVEIAAVDIETGIVYVYGEGSSFTRRIYLLYDGIHYDALAHSFNDSEASKSHDVKQFDPNDTAVLNEVKQLAIDMKAKKRFVNLSGCDLICNVCLLGLRGQKEAVEHAKQTGHQNFGQAS